MTQHGDHFSEFQPHTRLKHAIFDSYVTAWALKLLMWGGAGDRLAIVDAFAGPGQDRAGNDGSPVIAAKRAVQAIAEAKGRKPHLGDPKIDVFAIEKDAGQFRRLERCLQGLPAPERNVVRALRGELINHIDAILAEVGNRPTFYFLDPFGIKGLDARTYPKALAGPHNEVFALFADIGAVRLHGLVTADRADPSDEIAAIVAAPSLFPDDDARGIAAVEEAATRGNKALDASIPASHEHLARALGTETWVRELDATPAERPADAFLDLFQQALIRAGALFVLVIPMRNDRGMRVYALVHASKSRAGFVTMKDCVSTGLRKAAISDSALDRIMADLSVDLNQMVRGLQTALAGHHVLWATEPHGLKAILLGHTPLFQFQCEELKKALKEAGVLRRVDRKEVCVFPSLTSSEANEQ